VAIRKRYHAARIARAGAGLAALATVCLLAGDASAQCVQTGSDVTCTGTDPNGFFAQNFDLRISVEADAEVQNAGSGDSLTVLRDTTVTIEETGSLTPTGTSSRGVRGQLDNTLINRGTIAASGNGAVGVTLGGQGTVTNEATGRILIAPGLLGGANIGISGGSSGTITNHGLIVANGIQGFGVTSNSDTQIVNTGTIRAPDLSGTGVVVGPASTLDNSGLIEAAGDEGVGVRLGGSGGSAVNTGTIRGGDGDGSGVHLLTAGASTFVNEVGGTIEAVSGVAVRGTAGASTFENAGTITGDVLLGDGDDVFRWRAGGTISGLLDGEDGDDSIVLVQPGANDVFDLGTGTNFESLVIGDASDPADAGTWRLSGSGSFVDGIFVRGGTAQLGSGLTIDDRFTVEGGTARMGDGTSFARDVTVTGGTVLFEDGTSSQTNVNVQGGTVAAEGSATLVGDLAIDPSGTYRATFDAADSSRLDVVGNVDIQAGANLALESTDGEAVIQTYRVLTASDGITGEFDDLGSSAFQFTRTIYGPTAGASFLDVEISSTFTAPARTPNQTRVGQHLDLASAIGGSPDFQAFLDTLNQITDDGQASKALESLHPEFYDAHTSASFETARTYAEMLTRRPLRCERLVSPHRPDRPSKPPCSRSGFTPWAVGFGGGAKRSGSSDYSDWSYGGGGLAFGVDHDLRKDVLLSALVGTSRVGLDFDGDGDGSLTTFEMGLAGTWRHGGTHIRGVLEYGHGWHTTHRQVDIQGFSRLALSDHDSDRVTVLVEAGHAFVKMPFEVEPLASLEYTYLHEDSTSESNAGVAGLDIGSRSNALFATNTGVRASMTLVKYHYAGAYLEWADGVWRPELRASYRHVWNDYERALSSRLSGAPNGTPDFRTRTEDAEYGADLGGRVTFQPHGSRNTIEVGYDAFFGDSTTVHSAMLRFKVPF
jgi:uncharacterized protein with beta-barrel porin domain